jgi:hypothetical protein
MKPLAEWRNRRSPRHDIVELQDAYFEQLHCAMTEIQAILQALDGKPSIVIVHGDHGSRITTVDPKVENAGRFGADDLIAGHSTLFALRTPGLTPAYDAARLPIDDLLEALVRSDFRSAEVDVAAGFRPSIVLEDFDWQPVDRVALPPAWVDPQAPF